MKRTSVDNTSSEIKDTSLNEDIKTIPNNASKEDGREEIFGVTTINTYTITNERNSKDEQSELTQDNQIEKQCKIRKQTKKDFDTDRYISYCTYNPFIVQVGDYFHSTELLSLI